VQGASELGEWVGRQVVLDTAGPIVYIGTLERINREGYWLTEADVHDRNDGQASKELYVLEVSLHGIRATRGRVFVMRTVVISASLLDEVIS